MPPETNLEKRLRTLFREKLNLDVPSAETELLATGLLDSLLVIDLLLHIEQTLGCSLPMAQVDLQDFRTIRTIARCIERTGEGQLVPSAAPPAH